jgi:hypothetical protein
MPADKALVEFSRLLHGDIIDRSRHSDDEEGAGEFKENAFTDRIISDLVEAGIIEDAQVCYHEERGIKVNGYGINDDGDRLDLITTIYQHGSQPEPVTREEINTAIRRARRFFQFCLEGKAEGMEKASPAYEMVHQIQAIAAELPRVRILVFTDGIAAVRKLDDSEVDGVFVVHDVWDIERLQRLDSSGRPHESVELDITGRYGSPLPCLKAMDSDAGYTCFLAMVPGQILHDLYDEYRGQLLELNVRSFLQAKGKVNKGIQETLRTEPNRFLAYNNGITATAEDVKTQKLPGGGIGISFIKGLQIVNGGQTTASIHLAKRKGRIPLDGVVVQMKLNQVGPELLEDLVPKISRYANSQNKVSDADFSANDPFHRKIEELSRTIWAPGEESQWFYERARGQYQVAKALAAARKSLRKAFEVQFPPSQVFNKTDLAKYENSWDQRPYAVCKGNQKNFSDFTLSLQNRAAATLPDEVYFKRLVAKAILFRQIEKVVRNAGYEAYRANIVTYAVSYMAFKTVGRIDLDRIWSEQDISEQTREYAGAVAAKVQSVLKKTSGNIGEWSKKPECWEQVRALDVKLPRALTRELASDGHDTADGERRVEAPDGASPEQLEQMAACMQVSSDDWFRIHKWGIGTGQLANWEAGIAMTLAGYSTASWEKKPSVKQAKHGARIIQLARKAGVLGP